MPTTPNHLYIFSGGAIKCLREALLYQPGQQTPHSQSQSVRPFPKWLISYIWILLNLIFYFTLGALCTNLGQHPSSSVTLPGLGWAAQGPSISPLEFLQQVS